MTRGFRILMVIAAGLIAAGLGVVVSRQYLSPREPAADGTGCLPDLQAGARLIQELKLSSGQAAEIRTLDGEYRQTLARLCQEHCAVRARMPRVLFSAAPDAAETRDLLERMCRMQLESDLITVEHIRKIHRLLTPEQQTRYEKLVSQCVCGDCPSGMHACETH